MIPMAGAAHPPDGQYDADIVILSLERTDETIAAIASACAQTAVSFHIFVLDQGSCSTSLARLACAIKENPKVSLFVSGSNLGVAGGRNVISNMGHGRVIVALDNDAEFADTLTVARMVAALDAEPRLGAIGCRIVRYADGRDDRSSWGYPDALMPSAGACFDTVTFVGAGHSIRRDTWQQAGGYDPRLFFCWEEYDFCLRAIAHGWQVRYRGDIVIRHKVCGEQRVGWSANRWFYHVRNRLYIERKLGRSWVSLTPRIGGYLLKGLRNDLREQTVQAIRAAVSMVPDATQTLPPAGKSYFIRNDKAHRGSVQRRLLQEVFSRIAAAPTGQ
ncbi:MAG TPA: glycosyl transferase [Acetobacteraceae bacterium]|jgi:GT2 family glycosyltransferase|nr:glycosyl transferase [Acetobacteraceae bacterium]